MQSKPHVLQPCCTPVTKHKAKRAKPNREDDAVLLSIEQFSASLQPGTMTPAASSDADHVDSIGNDMHQSGLVGPSVLMCEQPKGISPRVASLSQDVMQVKQASGNTCAWLARVLQISGFMNYLVFSVQLIGLGDHGDQHASASMPQEVPEEENLQHSSLIDQAVHGAIEAAMLRTGEMCSVVAVDVHIEHDYSSCHVICFDSGFDD